MKLSSKNKKYRSLKSDPRKHPKSGYDEKQPNKKFPVDSGVSNKRIIKNDEGEHHEKLRYHYRDISHFIH